MKYTNFYETVREANMRLRGTVILYDKEPYIVLVVTDHKKDGIFRIYLEPTGAGNAAYSGNLRSDQQCPIHTHPVEENDFGSRMDSWMEDNKSLGVLRKQMNSPLFDLFRPFPLGLINLDSEAMYVERTPARRTEQGLTSKMLEVSSLKGNSRRNGFNVYSSEFKKCIKGDFPSMRESFDRIREKGGVLESVGFSRLFGLAKGPVRLPCLFYKDTMIGYLPSADPGSLILDDQFRHLRESIDEMSCFNEIIVQQ